MASTFAELISRHKPKYFYLSGESIDTDEDLIIVHFDIATGTAIRFRSTGDLPAPLDSETTYYAIKEEDDDEYMIKIASSYEDAGNDIAIDIENKGSGIHHYYLA